MDWFKSSTPNNGQQSNSGGLMNMFGGSRYKKRRSNKRKRSNKRLTRIKKRKATKYNSINTNFK